MKDERDGEDVKKSKSWAGRQEFKLLRTAVLARVGTYSLPMEQHLPLLEEPSILKNAGTLYYATTSSK